MEHVVQESSDSSWTGLFMGDWDSISSSSVITFFAKTITGDHSTSI